MGRMVRHRVPKIAKRSRTIPIYGDPDRGNGLDSGVLFKCWYCGQINNTRKQALGGSDAPGGNAYEDYADTPDYGSTGQGVAVLGGVTHSFTAQRNGSDGSPYVAPNAIRASDSGSGCMFCGTLNYRGDFP